MKSEPAITVTTIQCTAREVLAAIFATDIYCRMPYLGFSAAASRAVSQADALLAALARPEWEEAQNLSPEPLSPGPSPQGRGEEESQGSGDEASEGETAGQA